MLNDQQLDEIITAMADFPDEYEYGGSFPLSVCVSGEEWSTAGIIRQLITALRAEREAHQATREELEAARESLHDEIKEWEDEKYYAEWNLFKLPEHRQPDIQRAERYINILKSVGDDMFGRGWRDKLIDAARAGQGEGQR